jgi:hypothetical protein
MAEPFAEVFLNVELPIVKEITLYTRFGDIWGQIFVFFASALLLAGAVRIIIRACRKGGKITNGKVNRE